jgi:hypothetical protein
MKTGRSATFLALLALLAWSGGARADQPLELAVKATYLYKLAPFVTWPATAWGAPNAPLVICIQGQDPFGPVIDRAIAGQRIGGRQVVVRRLPHIDAASGCQIAYLAGSDAQPASVALNEIGKAPVLTVTDQDRGPGAVGDVHLVLLEGRVRFVIDNGQAQQQGLAISSKLLALALKVKR